MIMFMDQSLMISFLLIDYHELLRLGIRFALEEAFPDARILEAESLSSGLVCLQATSRPNLVLLDSDLSIAGGGALRVGGHSFGQPRSAGRHYFRRGGS